MPQQLCHFSADGLTYFEDLLDEKSLHSSLVLLEKDYDDVINRQGELDERMLLNEEDSLLGNGSLSGSAINICSTKVSWYHHCTLYYSQFFSKYIFTVNLLYAAEI